MSNEEIRHINLCFNSFSMVKNISGHTNINFKILEKFLKIKICSKKNNIRISGLVFNVKKSHRIIRRIYLSIKLGRLYQCKEITEIISNFLSNNNSLLEEFNSDFHSLKIFEKQIKAKTKVQKKYIKTIKKYGITFAIGPAGTGKTYLAVAMAMSDLENNNVKKIVLTRPAIEAGESLGFLPGDLYDKVNPYLKPLYDALYDIISTERVSSLINNNIIEIVPIAFMRGRTFNRSFIILDEGQNTTSVQMKMLLTRMGDNSKIVVTGDVTQIDLPNGEKSGLEDARNVLYYVDGVKFVFFSKMDIIRHKLVKNIVDAYEMSKKRTNY